MDLKKFIANSVRKYLTEQETYNPKFVDFNNFPPDILKTLNDEYGQYFQNNFDWNSKQQEFNVNGQYDGKGFHEWMEKNNAEEFLKNLDTLIKKMREDLILIIKKKNATKALNDFEELIIPVLGNEVLVEPLSKFMEVALLNLHSTKEIERAFQEAKNIIDNEGSIDHTKITPSDIFTGDSINLANFERFVQKNPDYQGVFNDWKKLFDFDVNLSLQELNAYRSSTSYNEIRKLYDYLLNFKKSL